MRRFVLVALLVVIPACGSLQAEYIKRDRATYDALAPIVSRLSVHEPDSDKRKDIEGLMVSWDARLDDAEALLAEQEKGD